MKPSAHIIQYRGFEIIFENGLYWIKNRGKKKYDDIEKAKSFINSMDHFAEQIYSQSKIPNAKK
jgi:predicted esterase